MLRIKHIFSLSNFSVLCVRVKKIYNYIHVCIHTEEERDNKEGEREVRREGGRRKHELFHSTEPIYHIIEMFLQENLYHFI